MKTTTAAMISILTCLALASGCASPAESNDVEGATAAISSPDPNVGMWVAADLMEATPTATTSIASTRKGVGAWRYDVSAHGFVMTAVNPDQTDGVRIAYGMSKVVDGKSYIVGVVISTQNPLDAVRALTEHAKRDLDAALANVGEVTDPTNDADITKSPTTAYGACDTRYKDVLAVALRAIFLDGASIVPFATGAGAAIVSGFNLGTRLASAEIVDCPQ